jgi:hypothetical protein
MHRPAFVALVRQTRDQLVSDAVGRLVGKTTPAIEALSGLLASPQEHVRLGAAGRLLDLLLRFRGQEQLQRDLEAVKDDLSMLRAEYPLLFKGNPNNEL